MNYLFHAKERKAQRVIAKPGADGGGREGILLIGKLLGLELKRQDRSTELRVPGSALCPELCCLLALKAQADEQYSFCAVSRAA